MFEASEHRLNLGDSGLPSCAGEETLEDPGTLMKDESEDRLKARGNVSMEKACCVALDCTALAILIAQGVLRLLVQY